MKWLFYYILFQIIVLLAFWIFSKKKDRRYKKNAGVLTSEFEPTQEVSVDPITQVLTRVYINPQTGERKYVEETKP
jgi:hypothetical protein